MEGKLFYVGLNYAGVEARLRRRDLTEEMWEGLATMEAEARKLLNGGTGISDDA